MGSSNFDFDHQGPYYFFLAAKVYVGYGQSYV